MLKLVVDEKIRPQMKTGCHSWRINSLHGRSPMYELCDTIEDLWEREEGARISAACLGINFILYLNWLIFLIYVVKIVIFFLS